VYLGIRNHDFSSIIYPTPVGNKIIFVKGEIFLMRLSVFLLNLLALFQLQALETTALLTHHVQYITAINSFSRSSSGSIVSDYGPEDRATEIRFPAEAKRFFL
jgi:hypothetical protein